MRGFIFIAAMAIASCGGGTDISDITSGFGMDDVFQNMCGNVEGYYSGPAVSSTDETVGVMALSLRQNDECDLTGAVAFPPCVPVTGVTGKAGLVKGFTVQTITPSPSLAISSPPRQPPAGSGQGIVIGETIVRGYILIGCGAPGCPASASGTVTLTRTG